MQVECGGHPAVETHALEIQGILLAFQGVQSDMQQVPICEQGEIRIRHLGDQTHLRAPARLDVAVILLQALVIETANATEHVQLIRRESDAGIEVTERRRAGSGAGARDARPSRAADAAGRYARHRGRILLDLLQCRGIDLGKQIGPLDLILSAGGSDVVRRNTLVRIVLQRRLYQFLEARVREEIAPANVGRRKRRGAGHGCA
jgi:hypothetical protein